MMRQKCEDAAPGSARARRCASGTYPSSPSTEAAAGASGSSDTVPLGRIKAKKASAPADEKKFLTRKLGFTPAEAKALSGELMAKYDADGDGKLTAQQFRDILKGLGKKGGASSASTLPALALAFLVRACLA